MIDTFQDSLKRSFSEGFVKNLLKDDNKLPNYKLT